MLIMLRAVLESGTKKTSTLLFFFLGSREIEIIKVMKKLHTMDYKRNTMVGVKVCKLVLLLGLHRLPTSVRLEIL